jgi:hypothetical protein
VLNLHVHKHNSVLADHDFKFEACLSTICCCAHRHSGTWVGVVAPIDIVGHGWVFVGHGWVFVGHGWVFVGHGWVFPSNFQ